MTLNSCKAHVSRSVRESLPQNLPPTEPICEQWKGGAAQWVGGRERGGHTSTVAFGESLSRAHDKYIDKTHVPLWKVLWKLRMRRASLYISLSDGLYLFSFYLSILDMCGPIKE